MPFVVQNLGLTAGEYGLVVSAFALAKMSGNIPSAVLVERHGRKVRTTRYYPSFHVGCMEYLSKVLTLFRLFA